MFTTLTGLLSLTGSVDLFPRSGDLTHLTINPISSPATITVRLDDFGGTPQYTTTRIQAEFATIVTPEPSTWLLLLSGLLVLLLIRRRTGRHI